MSGRIVVVGSLNADLVVRVERFPAPGETVAGRDFSLFPGGKGANQACAVARLGGRACMIGAVGDDAYGTLLTASLAGAGVDTSGIRRREATPTGVAVITLDASGQNQIVLAAGANGALAPEDVAGQERLFAGAAAVLVQQEVPLATVESAMALGRRAGARVVLDPAPAVAGSEVLLPLADYVTPNESELAALAGAEGPARSLEEAARQSRLLLSRGARCVVAKLGARGAHLVGADRETTWPAAPVAAVDTTAAGDVWNGAFAVALAEGRSENEAGAFACAAAALSVTRPGAQPSMPTRAELEAWNRDGHPTRRNP